MFTLKHILYRILAYISIFLYWKYKYILCRYTLLNSFSNKRSQAAYDCLCLCYLNTIDNVTYIYRNTKSIVRTASMMCTYNTVQSQLLYQVFIILLFKNISLRTVLRISLLSFEWNTFFNGLFMVR